MKKVVKLFLVVVLLLCIQGAVNTESAYSKMKMYKEGKTYTLTGKVQRINYEILMADILLYIFLNWIKNLK